MPWPGPGPEAAVDLIVPRAELGVLVVAAARRGRPARRARRLRGAAGRRRAPAPRPRHRRARHPPRDGLDRRRGAPAQGLLPGPGDGLARREPGPPAAPAGAAAPAGRGRPAAPARHARCSPPRAAGRCGRIGHRRAPPRARHRRAGPAQALGRRRRVARTRRCGSRPRATSRCPARPPSTRTRSRRTPASRRGARRCAACRDDGDPARSGRRRRGRRRARGRRGAHAGPGARRPASRSSARTSSRSARSSCAAPSTPRAALAPERRAAGLVTHSSGNHGRALAWVARRLGVPCTVVVPDDAVEAKVEAMAALGARLVRVPADERESAADAAVAETGGDADPALRPPRRHRRSGHRGRRDPRRPRRAWSRSSCRSAAAD